MIKTPQNNTILRDGLTRTPGRLLTNQITSTKLHNDGVMTFNPSVTLSELAGKFRIFWNPRWCAVPAYPKRIGSEILGEEVTVYTDSSCLNSRDENAVAGSGE